MHIETDILFVADLRFPGGTSTALAAEIEAAAQAGLDARLLAVRSGLLKQPRPVHPQIRALLDDGRIRLADPAQRISARVTVIHHPMIFTRPPDRRIDLTTRQLVLVLHHPPVDAGGTRQYDLAAVVEAIEIGFGRLPLLAPVGPLVRAALKGVASGGAPVAGEDWFNLIDVDRTPPRGDRVPGEGGAPVVIGRHARPNAQKWPDTRAEALAAYPAEPRYRVRVLGGGPFLETLYGPLPATWEVLEFGAEPVDSFLGSLDFYVYFHGSSWTEAFGRAVLEALAAGLVTILPKSFEPLFGPGAVYAEPADVRSIIDEFLADPRAYRLQAERARATVKARFGLERFAARIAALDPVEPAMAPRPVRRGLPPVRVLMMSSNGIGLGHLSRLLAVAKRLPPDVEPVFFTLSNALKIVVDAGYLAEYVPFHRGLAADVNRWNAVFGEEVHEAIAFYRPRALVFDGNVPYGGLLSAKAAFPEMMSFWIRRAMWGEGHAGALDRAAAFDAVIEPGEIAEAFDRGPTRAARGDTHRVGPVLNVDVSERLDRASARRELKLGEGDTVVALQLGSGNNYDLGGARAAVLSALAAHPGVTILEIVSPVRDGALPESTGPRHRVIELYPSFRLSEAFDFAVSAAGYNSFHEAIMGAIPTIFVPNEAEEMDRQILRARYADLRGHARLMRTRDLYAAPEIVGELMDPSVRARMRAACRSVAAVNGAAEIARFIAEQTRLVRTDYDVIDLHL